MRATLAVIAVLAAVVCPSALAAPVNHQQTTAPVLAAIHHARAATAACRQDLGLRELAVSQQQPQGRPYRRWVLNLWTERRDHVCGIAERVRSPEGAIRHVFGRYGDEAMRVANCETGGTYSVWAGYGKHQYLGLFQMGSRERAAYGHGTTPYAQARAAYRYFAATGYDWSPWQCRPDGSLAW